MGRGGKQKQWGKDHGAGVQDYQLWRGSWSPRLRAETQGHPWREHGHKDHGAAPIFPAYDAMPHSSRDARPGNPEQPIQHGRSHGLQELLNTARKAEIKLQKLIRAKDRAADQWEAFQKGLKESFLKEQSRFNKNGIRLDRDIEEATAEQDRAYEAIQQSVLRGGEGLDSSMGNADADESWDRMRSGWEQDEGESMDQVLRRAVQAPRTAASEAMRKLSPEMQQLLLSFGAIPPWAAGAHVSGAGATRTVQGYVPSKDSANAAPDAPPEAHSGAPSASALPADPGQACPSHGRADMQISPAHPGQRDMSRPRVPTSVEQPRPDIKAATMGPTAAGAPHSQLAGKIGGPTSQCYITGHEAFPWWNRPGCGGRPRGLCSSYRGPFGPGDDRSGCEKWAPVPGTGSNGMSWLARGRHDWGEAVGPSCGPDALRSGWWMWLSPRTSCVSLPVEEVPLLCLSPDSHDAICPETGSDFDVHSALVQLQALSEQAPRHPIEALSAVSTTSSLSGLALERAHWDCVSPPGFGPSSSAHCPAHLLGVDGTWAPPRLCFRAYLPLPPFGFRQRLTAVAWLRVAVALFLCWLVAGAQNMCIGCSGTQALHVSPFSVLLWLDSVSLLPQLGFLFGVSRCRDLAKSFSSWVDAVGASPRIVLPEFHAGTPESRHLEGLRGKSVALGSPPGCLTIPFCAWMLSLLAVSTRLDVRSGIGEWIYPLIEQQAGSLCLLTLVALQLGLFALLRGCFRTNAPGRRARDASSRVGALADATSSLGRISSVHDGPLCWRTPSAKRRKTDKETALCRRRSFASFARSAFMQLFVFVIGFVSLPVPCQAHYTWAYAAPLLMPVPFVDGVPYSPNLQVAERAPHDVPVEELADHVGEPVLLRSPADWAFLGEDRDSHWVVDAECPLPSGRPALQGRWLGVVVLTPHYRTQYAAIRCRDFHGPQHVAEVIVDSVPGGPPGVGVICVPVRPQRSVEYATFIRFPVSVRQHPHGRRAAVILDLTLTGGNCFPCLLPQQFTVSELVAFVTPLIPDSDLPLRLYVAEATQPHHREQLVLQDGFVLSFEHAHFTRPQAPTVADLFAHPSRWCEPARVPHDVVREGVLVHHGLDRFFMPPHHHAGQTVLDAARVVYDHDAAASVSCVFRTPDLNFRGHVVSHILFVAGVTPRPANATAVEIRRDHFVFCDFRPVGYNPRIVHTSVPIIHVPSVAAMYGIRVPAGMRLCTLDGSCSNDEVRFSGNPVLTFVLEDCPDDASAALSSGVSPTSCCHYFPCSVEFEAPPRA